MRVVLDTNVVVAAFATRGLCQDVFELCLKETHLILSDLLLKEIQRVFSDKIRLPPAKIDSILALLTDRGEIVTPVLLKENICRDPDDVKILGTAKSGRADVIVTGDEDLLYVKNFDNILIVSPREFWALLTRKNR